MSHFVLSFFGVCRYYPAPAPGPQYAVARSPLLGGFTGISRWITDSF